MEAATRGAVEAGAIAVGFLPGTDTADANPYLTVAIPTGLGEGRNTLLVTASRAVIAVGGSWGTESEIAFAVRTGTPVVGLDGWSRVDADGNAVDGVLCAADPAEAVATVLARLHPTTSGTE